MAGAGLLVSMARAAPRSRLLAVLLVGCGGGILDSGDAGDAGKARDAGKASAPFACHDDDPAFGTVHGRAAQPCTLADGGAGVVSLTFGCIDPNACQCRPEGGPAACAVGDAGNPHCVYATCNGRNEDEACALPGGGEGVCCMGLCNGGLANGWQSFPSTQENCGDCGSLCPTNSTCSMGSGVCSPGCPTDPCPEGFVCYFNICNPEGCASARDGSRCSAKGTSNPGICCSGMCVDPFDNSNCGGCGITCCPGRQCAPANSSGITGLCLPM
jgi:hypothetical protein